MKKYLLASTVMVAVAGFGASVLAAKVPTINGSVHPKDKRLNIELDGQFTPTAWAGNQTIEFIPVGTFGFAQNPVAGADINKTRGYDFRNYYNRLNVRVFGVADAWDLEYQARARFAMNAGTRNFEANDVTIGATNPTFIDRLSMAFWGKWGFVEFGDDTGRIFKDNQYSGNIATGIGGWDSYLIGNEFITSVNALTSPFPDQVENNFTKVSYKSPFYNGFSLGLTFTPDTSHRGDSPLVEVNNNINGSPSFENVYDVSLEFNEKFYNDKAEIKALVGWIGSEHENQLDDVTGAETFTVSGMFDYAGFQIAGDYADFNNQGVTAFGVANGVDAGRVWDAGIAYRTGAWGIFASYMNTSRNTGNLTSASVVPTTGAFISPVAVDTTAGSVTTLATSAGVLTPGDAKSKVEAISAGVEFTLAPGLSTFLEFTHAEANDNTTVSILTNEGVGAEFANVNQVVTGVAPQFQNNSGDFVVIGTKLKF